MTVTCHTADCSELDVPKEVAPELEAAAVAGEITCGKCWQPVTADPVTRPA